MKSIWFKSLQSCKFRVDWWGTRKRRWWGNEITSSHEHGFKPLWNPQWITFYSTMHKTWTRRRLTVLMFTFFIILFVDLQLRTSDPPKLSVVPAPPAGALQRAIQNAPSASRGAQRPAGGGSREAGHPTTEGPHVTQPKLRQEDIFIAVKTTGRFHKTRLALLVETWISRTKAHVSPCGVCAALFKTSYTVRTSEQQWNRSSTRSKSPSGFKAVNMWFNEQSEWSQQKEKRRFYIG